MHRGLLRWIAGHKLLVGAVAVAVVAGLIWWSNGDDDVSGDGDTAVGYRAERMAELRTLWPTAGYQGEDFLGDARRECADPDLCHVLWAEVGKSDTADPDDPVEKLAYVAEYDDSEGAATDFRVRTFRMEGAVEDSPAEERTAFSPDDPLFEIEPIDQDYDQAWLFPADTHGIVELYHDVEAGEVRADKLETTGISNASEMDESDFERTRYRDYDDLHEDRYPALRYERDGETGYIGLDGRDVCVDESGGRCFPSEGAFVSAAPLADLYRMGPHGHGIEGHFMSAVFDPNTAVEAEFTTDNVAGRPARISWGTGDEATATTLWMIYFDDGYPAVISDPQDPEATGYVDAVGDDEEEDTSRVGRLRGISGAAAFGSPAEPDDTPRTLVAFHPSGTPPLVSPEQEVAWRGEGATVYETGDAQRWTDVAFIHRSSEDSPIQTQVVMR
ncbi:hypothetical protein HDA32_005745 [Spinactinospora alkalitolerans]|uniref:Uncharacterized protein n=1 Tax=Spinactinospora alkalitolerans TaxID=687207 RepID=A0A852U503_9ACTN|nr:hypothetical protein [Spinactinospora alkalitolerans]NYE50625.1 hypothetical protein [Spinactinospora alkalitolerans]